MDKYAKPRGFEDFAVVQVSMPDKPDVLRIYDIEHKTIRVNTAAAPDANIIRIEPKR